MIGVRPVRFRWHSLGVNSVPSMRSLAGLTMQRSWSSSPGGDVTMHGVSQSSTGAAAAARHAPSRADGRIRHAPSRVDGRIRAAFIAVGGGPQQ